MEGWSALPSSGPSSWSLVLEATAEFLVSSGPGPRGASTSVAGAPHFCGGSPEIPHFPGHRLVLSIRSSPKAGLSVCPADILCQLSLVAAANRSQAGGLEQHKLTRSEPRPGCKGQQGHVPSDAPGAVCFLAPSACGGRLRSLARGPDHSFSDSPPRITSGPHGGPRTVSSS